jgi:alpha-aminoadipate/glutamate carrier protein LysW
MATCPECEFDEIDTEDFDEGDTLSCPECGKSLVVMGSEEEEEDDDDDEDDEDDEDEEEVEE